MTKHSRLDRRAFVGMMGLTPVVMQTAWTHAISRSLQCAYVGAMKDGIHVFGIRDEGWKLKQVIASAAPVSLAMHPNRRFLYVVNEVAQHEGLPSGSVEAFAVGPDGTLRPLNRRSLSLSATLPRHLTLSPDGKSAIVAVHGGGAYNMLPIGKDGQLGRVISVVKETGSGPNGRHQLSAHPQMLLFDKTGKRLLTSDMGSDRVNVLTLNEGGLMVLGRYAMDAGSGPKQIVMHPAGHLIYVANELNGSVCGYEYDQVIGRILRRVEWLNERVGGAMVLHPSGDFLYTVGTDNDGTIQSWRVDAASGRLSRTHEWNLGPDRLHAIKMDRDSLIVLSDVQQGVIRFSPDPATGQLNDPVVVAKVSAPRSVTML